MTETMEFDYKDLHFVCYRGGMTVTRNVEEVGQVFDAFTKGIPPKEKIIEFWEALIASCKE